MGTLDPLLDDTLFMAGRWKAAGNLAQLDVWPGAQHAFDLFDNDCGRSRESACTRSSTRFWENTDRLQTSCPLPGSGTYWKGLRQRWRVQVKIKIEMLENSGHGPHIDVAKCWSKTFFTFLASVDAG